MIDAESLPDATQIATPIFVLLVVAELLLVSFGRLKGRYEPRDSAASMVMGTGSVVGGALLGGLAHGALVAVWDHRLLTLSVSLPMIAAAFILDDFRYYWWHRLAHRCRWFWADHVIHHSSQHYNLTTALRQPWFSTTSGAFLLRAPLVLAGFHPGMLAFCGSLNLVYQFWIHTETIGKMPAWFEGVFNTPSHHRVHHGRNPKYLDANYGGTLIIWDRMFGSFVGEDADEPVRYGLVHSLGTFNPLRIATHEYLAMARDAAKPGLTPGQRLKYLFAEPGWSHDGSRQTSRQIKSAEARRKSAG